MEIGKDEKRRRRGEDEDSSQEEEVLNSVPLYQKGGLVFTFRKKEAGDDARTY